MSQFVKHLKHWVATLAKRYLGKPLTSIHHKLDRYLLAAAHTSLSGNKATGIDDETKAEFSENVEARLDELVNQARKGTYRAPAVRRVEIPKGDGKTRPIGVPTYADKVVQKGFVMLVEPVFEQEFHPGSYGYRPGRSCHGAIRALNKALYEKKTHWVIELDIKGFFDNISHEPLREMFSRRISDGVLNHLVLGWLKAGVMKKGIWETSENGTPQGGIVSPLLANLYLHEVLDNWLETAVRPRLSGNLELIRYADDAVICLSNEADARKVLEVLPKRFGKYGLTLHPDKTKLVDFRPPKRGKDGKHSSSESFDFLGYTLYWGLSRRGYNTVKVKTQQKRYAKGLEAITKECRSQRHEPMKKQQEVLRQKLQGHIGYYGVTHNFRWIEGFVRESVRIWCKWLNRRGSPKMLKLGELWEKIKRNPWVKIQIRVSIYE